MVDIQTFMLVLAIGNIAFAMLIAGYARSGPVNPALSMWQWAKLVQGCAHLLGWLRPDWPGPWLSVAANSTLILGVMLEAAAYCTFFGFPRWQHIMYPACLLALLAYDGAHFYGAAPGIRAMVMSVIIAVFTGAVAFALLRQRGGGSTLQRIIGINNLVFFGAMCMRAWTFFTDGSLTVFSTGAVQTFTYLTGYVLMIVNGFGFLLLCKQKDDAQMALLATVDSLTGLLNRRAFFEHTASARMLASRQRHPVALMMLDLDHFKSINDRYGHAVGDQALCVFAVAAQAALRDPDILARLGGEEFAVALPGTDLAGAMQAAERVRVAVKDARVPGCDLDHAFTVSIGVVLVDPDEHINAALARADRALYAAKSLGRNRVAMGEPIRKCA
ncbi:MAG: diguanylate cyclase [Pseudomonadota bacterium]